MTQSFSVTDIQKGSRNVYKKDNQSPREVYQVNESKESKYTWLINMK